MNQQPYRAQRSSPERSTGGDVRRAPLNQLDGAQPARAPYNFVPLPENIVTVGAELDVAGHDRFHEDLHTGHVEFSITTEGPVFVGGLEQPESFTLGDGSAGIPGSAIRGAIGSLFEIITWSRVRYVRDALLFYRRVPQRGGDPLGTSYLRQLGDNSIFAGAIARRGSQFVLRRSQFFRAPKNLLTDLGAKADFVREQVLFTVTEDGKRVTALALKKDPDRWSGTASAPESASHGWIIRPGLMKKSNADWVVMDPAPDAPSAALSRDAVEEYLRQEGGLTPPIRAHEFSVLPGEHAPTTELPAFFVERPDDDGTLILFGHTRFFRIPYAHRMSDRIPDGMARPRANAATQEPDLTDAVFGSTPASGSEGFRGRVSFEDARLVGDQTDVFDEPAEPLPTYSPRPTSYQHYLEQPGYRSGGSAIHWDHDDAVIRGHKMYWRRDVPWKRPQGMARPPGESSTRSLIRPVKEGTRFTSRVRFVNLQLHELGALLMALELPATCRHQIGFGKPIGLGTVRIDAVSVTETPRKDRYARLMSADGTGFHLPAIKQDSSALRAAFADWLLEKIHHTRVHDDPVTTFWELPRMKQLKLLLTWPPPDSAHVGDYMKPDEHMASRVLPWPDGAFAPTPRVSNQDASHRRRERDNRRQARDGIVTHKSQSRWTVECDGLRVFVPVRSVRYIMAQSLSVGANVRVRIEKQHPDGTADGKFV